MITFHQENIAEMPEEAQPLITQHAQEINSLSEEFAPIPNWEGYKEVFNNSGLSVTVRDDGELIGYCLEIVSDHWHYQGLRTAENVAIYLLPEYRSLGIAEKLIKAVQDELKEMGVHVHHMRVKPTHDFSSLLTRDGYEEKEIVWGKRL